jgi:hypothetical protein
MKQAEHFWVQLPDVQPKLSFQSTSSLMWAYHTSINISWYEPVKAFSQDSNPVSVNTSPVTVYEALFCKSCCAFRTQELLSEP